MPRILPVPLGTANTYIVSEGPASILIDAGFPRQGRKFFTTLSKQGMDPARISLIVITHVHYDHVGNLREIRDACRCPVAVPAGEADWLRRGAVVFPAGVHPVGRALIGAGRLLSRVLPGFVRFDPVEADVLVDGELSLDPFGMAGRI
ncbi:MAG TPA: MBL fold metallo-hydrolase, partial [Syntrophales bacterium]|nr:MBL fold metallo-hydrolase [Syntrophales bacterium]